MNNIELSKILCETYRLGQVKVHSESLRVNDLKILKLRDALIEIGKIDLEDLDTNLYIARVYRGFLKMNKAMLALHLDGDTLYITACAKEGLFNQNTCGGAVNELKEILRDHIK